MQYPPFNADLDAEAWKRFVLDLPDAALDARAVRHLITFWRRTPEVLARMHSRTEEDGEASEATLLLDVVRGKTVARLRRELGRHDLDSAALARSHELCEKVCSQLCEQDREWLTAAQWPDSFGWLFEDGTLSDGQARAIREAEDCLTRLLDLADLRGEADENDAEPPILTVDTERGVVSYRGREIRPTPDRAAHFAILEALAGEPGHTLTYRELQDAVDNRNPRHDENTLTSKADLQEYIKELRAAFEAAGADAKTLIQNRRQKTPDFPGGYRLDVPPNRVKRL